MRLRQQEALLWPDAGMCVCRPHMATLALTLTLTLTPTLTLTLTLTGTFDSRTVKGAELDHSPHPVSVAPGTQHAFARQTSQKPTVSGAAARGAAVALTHNSSALIAAVSHGNLRQACELLRR